MKKLKVVLFAMLLVVVLAACGNKDTNKDGGKIFHYGAQSYTDPKIVGQIVKLLVEDQTIHDVKITEDIQASPQIIAALEKEEFDFATLFSGEVYNNHFDDDQYEFTTDAAKTLEQAQNLFKEKFDFTWYDSTGFANQYSIAIPREYAEENNIETMSDLGEYAADLKVGSDSAWIERDNDGYAQYKETYGYDFKDVVGMEVSLMYEGISRGDLDVITAYTVDPHIIDNDLVLLDDDLQFFAPYEASIVASKSVEEYPEVQEILDSMVDLVSTEEMTEMIREVDMNNRSTEEVAKEFLQEKGLLD